MDFSYKILYIKNITKIKIKKLNNFQNQINLICQDAIIDINNAEKIIDLE